MKSVSRIVKVAAVAMVGLLIVQSALAATIERFDGYYSGSGGEYTIIGTGFDSYYHMDARGPNGIGFQSFCIELSEYSTKNPDDYTIGPAAVDGGVGGPSPDPISVGTEWLYLRFSDATLATYDYTPGTQRELDAYQLQRAFWWLEEELVIENATTGGNAYLTAMATALGYSDAQLMADAGAQSKVAAINFTKYDEAGRLENRQSMLVRVPDGGLTLMMLGAGVLGCMALRRRFTK